MTSGWKLFIDDSATHGSLLDKHFQPYPITTKGLLPVTAAGSILVRSSAIPTIEADVRELRRRIRRALKLDWLPELHMRLMWGNKLPLKDKLRENPYLLATREQIFSWCKDLLHIAFHHNKQNNLYALTASLSIFPVQIMLQDAMSNPEVLFEREYLRTKFRKDAFDYYKTLCNPLCRMILQCIIAANQFGIDKTRTVSVFYDTSEHSKGFSASELYERARDFGYLTHIDDVTESSARSQPLIQIADLVSFIANRYKLKNYRRSRGESFNDPGIDRLFSGINTSSMEPLLSVHRAKLDQDYAVAQSAIMHTYAAKKFYELDHSWCEENLATPYELLQDPTFKPSETDGTVLISMALQEKVRRRLMNGKRPPL